MQSFDLKWFELSMHVPFPVYSVRVSMCLRFATSLFDGYYVNKILKRKIPRADNQ